MTSVHKYTNYKDEFTDKISARLFYKFAVVLFAFYIVVLLCTQAFYLNYSYITISGESMQNTINPNPVEIVTKDGRERVQDGVFVKLTQDVDYGDIVILKSNISNKNKTIIKRVLAFEGDHITIARVPKEGLLKGELRFMRVKSGSTKVEILEENYIRSHFEWIGGFEEGSCKLYGNVYYEDMFFTNYFGYYQSREYYVPQIGENVLFFEVPQENVFFMGDNRANSTDARFLGTYNSDKIVGRVVEIVKNGTKYEGNHFWWFNRIVSTIKVCWQEVLRFFGANV